jgi:hypothetical protein
MGKLLNKFAAVILPVFILSCSEKQHLSVEDIQNRFGAEYTIDWNADSTFLLGIKKIRKISANHLSPLEYFVFDVNEDSILFKESVSGGSVNWISPTQIKINIIPGNITGDEDLNKLHYKFDVLKNSKITNGE